MAKSAAALNDHRRISVMAQSKASGRRRLVQNVKIWRTANLETESRRRKSWQGVGYGGGTAENGLARGRKQWRHQGVRQLASWPHPANSDGNNEISKSSRGGINGG